MTGRVIDNSSAVLILIIPIAFAVLVLYNFWPVLLILAILIVSWKVWENYQWQKWSEQINPYFNRLVRDNKGYLTPLDLSLIANLTAKSAKVFLERKADEYGVAPKKVQDKGLVYYFPTASALGRIFDDSDPFGDFDDEEEETSTTPQLVSSESATKKPNKSSIGELLKAKQEQNQTTTQVETESSTSAESIQVDAPMPAATVTEPKAQDSATETEQSSMSLSQADLSTRLEVHSSTVGRRKSQPDFPEWSQSRDPEGIAWQYLEAEQLFVPVEK